LGVDLREALQMGSYVLKGYAAQLRALQSADKGFPLGAKEINRKPWQQSVPNVQ